MSLCKNAWSYERAGKRSKRGYTSRASSLERQSLQKATRKFSRACERVLIEQGVSEMRLTYMDRAQDMVTVAIEVQWHIDDILAMYDDYECLPANLVWESQRLYGEFMQGVEIY